MGRMEIKTAGEINIEIATRYHDGEEWERIRKEKYVSVDSLKKDIESLEETVENPRDIIDVLKKRLNNR